MGSVNIPCPDIENELQKRIDRNLWKTLKKDRYSGRSKWMSDGNRIVGCQPDPTG